LATVLVFIDVSEDLIMANEVVTPSSLLVAPREEEELEKALLDVNVSLSQPHFEGSVRSPLTFPKMGLESPP
jgi:hypothetical protein